MEFFDVDQDLVNNIQYTDSHDNTENLIYLGECKCDCKLMLLEIKRLLLEDNYDQQGPFINPFRKKLLDKIQFKYKPTNKKSIRLFLRFTYKIIEDYTLGHIDILTFKFELFHALNYGGKKTEVIKNNKSINFLGSSKALFELIRLLYMGKFINKLTRLEILYHFSFNDVKFLKHNSFEEDHRIVWRASEKDFVYLINGLVKAGKLKAFWKYAHVKSHFIPLTGGEFKYLSQINYSFTSGSEDYKNEKLDQILDYILRMPE